MKPVRPTAVAVAVLLLGGCGGDPYTAPDIDLPVPPPPGLAAAGIEGWEDASIGSLCLEVSTDLETATDRDGATFRRQAERAIEAAGLPVGDEPCEAVLTIDVDFRVVSARYSSGRRCYNGIGWTAGARLAADGLPEVAAVSDKGARTPGSLPEFRCRKESDPIPAASWDAILMTRSGDGLLIDLFGDAVVVGTLFTPDGLVYTELGRGGFDDAELGDEPFRADVVVDYIVYHLAGGDDALRDATIRLVEDLAGTMSPRDRREILGPVVPYLIQVAARADAERIEESGGFTGPRESRDYRVLRRVTGHDIEGRADLWWEWYLETSGT